MLRRKRLMELSVLLGVGMRDPFWGRVAIALMVRQRVRRVINFHVLEALRHCWFTVQGFDSNSGMRRVRLRLMVIYAAATDPLSPSIGLFIARSLGQASVGEWGWGTTLRIVAAVVLQGDFDGLAGQRIHFHVVVWVPWGSRTNTRFYALPATLSS